MKDLLGLMGKAREMQAKFQAMQDEIATIEASGQSGGGLVSVTLSGKFEMKALKVDPSLLKDDEAEILEDLIVAAHNDARAKVEQAMDAMRRGPFPRLAVYFHSKKRTECGRNFFDDSAQA